MLDAFDWSANWLAITAATVAAVAVGFLWYSPFLFAPAWMRAIGIDKEWMRTHGPGPMLWVGVVGSAFLSAWVLNVLVQNSVTLGVADTVALVVLVWLGFVATALFNVLVFQHKLQPLWWIYAGHQLVALAVQGLIIALWP